MTKSRILVLTPDYLPQLYGGIGTYVSQLYKYFTRDKLKICFIPYGRTSLFPSEDGVISFDVHSQIDKYQKDSYIYWEKFNEISYEKIARYINESGDCPDIIHVHGSYFALLASSLKKNFSSKLVYIKHGVEHDYQHPSHLKDSIMILLADQVICPSQWVANEVPKAHPLMFSPMKTIHSGIEIQNAVTPVIKNNKILFCGRLSKRKGVDVLIKAVVKISSFLRLSGYTVDIIGTGDQENLIKELVKSSGISDIVSFRGYIENRQVLTEMAHSKILVIPSFDEPFGLVAVEGFSQEVCVVASRSGGLSEVITDNETGLLFEPGNDDELAQILKRLIENPAICEALIKKATAILSYFSWQRVYNQYEEAAISLFNSSDILGGDIDNGN